MKNSTHPYIVIDTNVLISAALLPHSKTGSLLKWVTDHFVIAQNEATFAELESRIERSKFDRYFGEDGRIAFLTRLAQVVETFPMQAKVQISPDADDDKFIGLALDAGAKMIVSGDIDLIHLKMYEEIEILSPTQFWDRFGSK